MNISQSTVRQPAKKRQVQCERRTYASLFYGLPSKWQNALLFSPGWKDDVWHGWLFETTEGLFSFQEETRLAEACRFNQLKIRFSLQVPTGVVDNFWVEKSSPSPVYSLAAFFSGKQLAKVQNKSAWRDLP